MIRVLITDDLHLWRMALRTFLQRDHEIDIVGEARDGQEAVELAERLSPDVILMDVQMPRMDGLRATEQITARQPHAHVVMLAAAWDDALVREAVRKGACGYLPKDIQPHMLSCAIRAVQADQTFFDARLAV